MALSLATLRSSVRGHLDEPTANYWTDAELNGLISSSERALWRKILSLKKDYFLTTATLAVTSGTSLYNGGDGSGMPSDLWRIQSIRTLTSGYQNIQWVETDPNSSEFLGGLNTDSPVANPYQMLYAVRNITTLAVSPIPQQSFSALLNYIQQPTVMVNDSDTFLIPDTFLDCVEYDATADALSKGPVGDATYWRSEANQAWKETMEALDTPRSSQSPDTVSGFGSEW